MKLSYSCLALSLGLAVGCGGAVTGTSASGGAGVAQGGAGDGTVAAAAVSNDSAAVSDTTTESADLTASLGQDNMTMGAGGFGGGGMGNDDFGSHVEIVGSLLMAMVSPKSCVSGTATFTMAPAKTSTCVNIGTYPGGATIAFSQCVLHDGATIDGSIVLDDERDLAANQTCSATAVIDATRTVTIASLTYTSKDKSVLAYTGVNASVVSEHALKMQPTMVTSKLTGERKITDSKATVVLDHSFDSSLVVTLTAKTATAPASETMTGTSTVKNLVAMTSHEVDLMGVEKVRDCCQPIAGTITVTKTAATDMGSSVDTTTFGPKCGDVNVNGKAITIPECL